MRARKCQQITPWGRCQQQLTEYAGALCSYHTHRMTAKAPEDRFYGRKVALGLLQPADAYLSPEELRASVYGVPKGDGRRLDAYALEEPLDIEAFPGYGAEACELSSSS